MIISVLKVIGIVLLVILALLLLLVAIVCFVPIRYRFNAKMDDEPDCDVLVKWLPVFLKVRVGYHQKVLEYRVRMFGGLVMTNTDDRLSWIGRRFFSGKSNDKKESANSETNKNKVTGTVIEDDIEWEMPEDKPKDNKASDKHENTEAVSQEAKKKKRKRSDKKKFSFKELKEKWNSFTDKLKSVNDKKEALLKVYHSKRFKVAKDDIKKYIKTIIKIIKPDKLSGYVEFGMDDPATTGEILGGLAVFLALYDNFLTVVPNFEEKVFKGNLDGKGKIYIISLLLLLIKVILNKNLIKVKKRVQTILEA